MKVENEEKKQSSLSRFIHFWWEKEPIRFLFAGAINTIVGVLLTYLFRHFLFDMLLKWNPKWVIMSSPIEISFDFPYLIAFIIGLPIAYTTQTLIAFRTKWSFKRFIRYPLSSIPNFFLQQLGILIFEGWLKWPYEISYILGCILPLPIMFFIIRFLVKPIKNKNKKEVHDAEENQ